MYQLRYPLVKVTRCQILSHPSAFSPPRSCSLRCRWLETMRAEDTACSSDLIALRMHEPPCLFTDFIFSRIIYGHLHFMSFRHAGHPNLLQVQIFFVMHHLLQRLYSSLCDVWKCHQLRIQHHNGELRGLEGSLCLCSLIADYTVAEV